MNNTARRAGAGVSALAVAAVVLVGCTPTPQEEAPSGASAFQTCADVDLSAAPAAPVPLRLAGAIGIEVYAGWFMMTVAPEESRPNAGVWYELENVPFADPTQRISAVQAGQVDGMMSSMPQVLTLADGGVDVKVVASLARTNNGSEADTRYVVDPGSGLSDFSDLEGKNVGVIGLGSTAELLARIAVESAGGDPNAATYVSVPPAEHISAVQAGTIDMGIGAQPFVGPALESGVVDDFGSQGAGLEELEGVDHVEPVNLAITTAYLEEHPEAACAYLADYRSSLEWLRSNTEEARAVFIENEMIALPEEVYLSAPANDWPEDDALPALDFYLAMGPYAEKYGFVTDGSEQAIRDVIWTGLGEIDE